MTRCLQAIVFDFDGVIADTERLHLLAYQQVLAPLNLALSDEDYYSRYLGYDDFSMLRSYARNQELHWDDGTILDLVQRKTCLYEDLSSHGKMLFPGVAEFLRAASAAVPLGIASGALTHEIEEILARTNLAGFFEAVVGADQTQRSKPSPDPYLQALYRLTKDDRALDPSRIVAIEDSRWGLVSAATAGLRCVAITNTYAEGELAPYAELVVDGFGRLTVEILDRLCESTRARRGAAATVLQP
jgi:beta-phosphoglucomutase